MSDLPGEAASGGTTLPSHHVRRRWTTAAGCIALTVSLAAAVAVAALLWRHRPGFWTSVVFAALICLPASLAGWILARRPTRKPGEAVVWPLAAIAVRLLPPLTGLAWLSTPAGLPLRERAAGELLVGFYLVQLATDVLLHIMVSRQHTGHFDGFPP